VPLDDIAFNEAKSGLKMLEYAALGVPVIASPTSDNARLHGAGIGVLASKPKHWASLLRRLLTDPDERAALAVAGRAAAASQTIEGTTDRWWDAWASCTTRKAVA
jgi:glycosyltransferase involved in cell wall biosynthesis